MEPLLGRDQEEGMMEEGRDIIVKRRKLKKENSKERRMECEKGNLCKEGR